MDQRLASIFRHALSTVGGALVAIGAEPSAVSGLLDSTSAVLAGIATWGIAQAWSLAAKKVRR